jgi:hypothetical protein
VEEEMKRLREEALGDSPSNLPGMQGLEDLLEPFSSRKGCGVYLSGNPHQLHVGKPQKQIVQSLDQKEKDALQQMIQDELEKYEQTVNKKYHAEYNSKCLTYNTHK